MRCSSVEPHDAGAGRRRRGRGGAGSTGEERCGKTASASRDASACDIGPTARSMHASAQRQPRLHGAARPPSSRCPPAAPTPPVEPRSGARRRIRPAPRSPAAPAAVHPAPQRAAPSPPRSCRADPRAAIAGRSRWPRPPSVPGPRQCVGREPHLDQRPTVARLAPAHLVGQSLDRRQPDPQQLAVDVGRKRGS